MGRSWFEVRVRECVTLPRPFSKGWENGVYTKKSRFYFVNSSQDAAKKYKGGGQIMHIKRVKRERLLGIGEFFKLGDKLLEEFKGGETLYEKLEGDKGKRRQRIHRTNIKRGADGTT